MCHDAECPSYVASWKPYPEKEGLLVRFREVHQPARGFIASRRPIQEASLCSLAPPFLKGHFALQEGGSPDLLC